MAYKTNRIVMDEEHLAISKEYNHALACGNYVKAARCLDVMIRIANMEDRYNDAKRLIEIKTLIIEKMEIMHA